MRNVENWNWHKRIFMFHFSAGVKLLSCRILKTQQIIILYYYYYYSLLLLLLILLLLLLL